MTCLVRLLLACLFLTSVAHAHVGSKDVYEQTTAGPYKLYVTIRMPNVIPGVAAVEVRSTGAPITSLQITPLPLTGEASKHPPTPDAMKSSPDDPAFFTGAVWMMASGSWQIRFNVSGSSGNQTVAVPVPAVAISILTMDRNLGILLALLGLFLIVSMAGVVAAAVREARLQPGLLPTPVQRHRSLIAMAASLIVMALLVYGGATWWNVQAASFSTNVYRPLQTHALLSGNHLDLTVQPFVAQNEYRSRPASDFIPDHGHFMHLYAIRQPGMDAVFHLHPNRSGAHFLLDLPAMPPGQYNLYADVVHANGFPETLVTSITVPPGMPASPPGPDDAVGQAPPIATGQLANSFPLPDRYTMVWDTPASLTANTAYTFHFHLLGPDGSPARDMQPYMGMAGHAAFVKTDGTVFAHVHPDGSAAMAAVMLANPSPADAMADMPEMTGISHPPGTPADPNANAVDFPYGFPSPGHYRIFVQMKHNTTVETGIFDATVR